MSTVARAIAEQRTNDMFTCLLPGRFAPNGHDLSEYEFVLPDKAVQCVDIGSPFLLEGMPAMVPVAGEKLSVADISNATAPTNYTEGIRLFGSAECGGNLVGDGTVNGFDMAVLLWSQFARPPYDTLPENRFEWKNVDTTTAESEISEMCCLSYGVSGPWTCADEGATNLTKAEYITAIAGDKCAFQSANVSGDARRLEASSPGRALQGEWSDEAQSLYDAEFGTIDVLDWASIAGVGHWTKITLPKTALALELMTLNVDPSRALPSLAFKAPPPYGCDDASRYECLPDPDYRDRVVITFHRRDDLIEEAGFTAKDCAKIFPAASPLVDPSGAIALYQEPASEACPFDIFVYTPEGTVMDENAACGGRVGVDVGSILNDGAGGFLQHTVRCAAAAVPSPPPPPAASPPATATPGVAAPSSLQLVVEFELEMGPDVSMADVDAVVLARFKQNVAAILGVSSAFVLVDAKEAEETARRALAAGVRIVITVLAESAGTASAVTVAISALSPAAASELFDGQLSVAAVGSPSVRKSQPPSSSSSDGSASSSSSSSSSPSSSTTVSALSGATDSGELNVLEIAVMAIPVVILLVGAAAVVALIRRRRKISVQNKIQPSSNTEGRFAAQVGPSKYMAQMGY